MSLRAFAYFLAGFLLSVVSVLAFSATDVVVVDYTPDGRLLLVIATFFAVFLGFRTGYRP